MDWRRRFAPLILAASVLPLSQVVFPGCATVLNGPTQPVRVVSKPKGAQVFLNGRLIGTTPTTAIVSRWGNHRVRIEMPGYEPFEVKLEKKYNGNASGNAFIGGAWIVVDVVTGSIFELDVPGPKQRYRWTTEDGPREPVVFNMPVYVTTELKPTPTSRRIGQLQRK